MTTKLQAAARAVIERWDSPLWKDLPATGESIAALRDALDIEFQTVTGWVNVNEELPDDCSDVFVSNGAGVTPGVYLDVDGFYWSFTDDVPDDAVITHWMPITMPPVPVPVLVAQKARES